MLPSELISLNENLISIFKEYFNSTCISAFVLTLSMLRSLVNSEDPNEMPHNAAFHLGLHSL